MNYNELLLEFMESAVLVIITILNSLSLLAYFVINQETKRVTESHIELIQKVNTALVETSVLKVARFAYFIMLVLLTGLSYILYFFWAS